MTGSLFRRYLSEQPAGSPIALETRGSYYWMVQHASADYTRVLSVIAFKAA